MATIAELQQQIAKWKQILASTPKTSPMYGAYVGTLNALKAQLASAQGTSGAGLGQGASVGGGVQSSGGSVATPATTPAPVTSGGGGFMLPGVANIVNSIVNDNVATPTATQQPTTPTNTDTWFRQSSEDMANQQSINNYLASGGYIPSTISATQAKLDWIDSHPLPTTTQNGGETTPSSNGGTPPPAPIGASGSWQWDEGLGDWAWTPNFQTRDNGDSGYWSYGSNGVWNWISLGGSGSSGSTRTQAEIDADVALANAQAAYYQAIAQGQSEETAQAQAELAWQQQQWAEQLAWYQQQAAMEAQQEAERLASERQSYLSDLAANPRQWIKYNLETTNEAGATPNWLSQLYEGKVATGESLENAKAIGSFPILSKNWYNWLTPSERDMLSGYISWAGTDPDDYWNNLWWMRGKQPAGAPRLAAARQN